MSLLLLIDGYNVVAPVAPPGRTPDPNWLRRERRQLLDRLVRHLNDETRSRTCVVFDAAAPPPGRPHRFTYAEMQVWFAVGYSEADDLLEELIAKHSSPKQLAVVSSDRRIQAAAVRRGSTAFEAQSWLDDLLDGRLRLARRLKRAGQGGGPEAGEKPTSAVEPDEIDDWLDLFGFNAEDP